MRVDSAGEKPLSRAPSTGYPLSPGRFPSGPARGYRHAFLEAGLVGERIYIEAGARGLGVCAVGAFYDAEAAALVAIDPDHEWVVHFAALGVPSA